MGTTVWEQASERLQQAHDTQALPRAVLEWTLGQYPGKTALTVSFGGGGLVLAHLLSEIDRSVPVIFLDTGMHFPETYAFKNEFVEKYKLNIVDVHPAFDPGPLYETDTDQCCAIRKVEPMARAVNGYDAWVSALRRDQSATRGNIGLFDLQRVNEQDVLKVYPLAFWTRSEVWRYLYDNGVPYHPLLDQGYTSIGCWPCTRATRAGEDERAGRWSGSGKTECGLHNFAAPGTTTATATTASQPSDNETVQ